MTTNRHGQEGPLDDRGQIPGQMDVYEVLAELEAEKTGKDPVSERPIRASDVQPSTELSPDELRRQRVKDAVAGRLARRKGLRKAGADIPPSSDDLAARIDYGLRKADERVGINRRAQAQAAVRAKRQGKT